MNTTKKVPVVILNGFLGSGKTTLFRSLLAQSKRKNISICAIVNDMSELDDAWGNRISYRLQPAGCDPAYELRSWGFDADDGTEDDITN